MKSKGLGDSVEKLTKFTGIHPIVKKLVKNCNCEDRKARLNNPELHINKLLYGKSRYGR